MLGQHRALQRCQGVLVLRCQGLTSPPRPVAGPASVAERAGAALGSGELGSDEPCPPCRRACQRRRARRRCARCSRRWRSATTTWRPPARPTCTRCATSVRPARSWRPARLRRLNPRFELQGSGQSASARPARGRCATSAGPARSMTVGAAAVPHPRGGSSTTRDDPLRGEASLRTLRYLCGGQPARRGVRGCGAWTLLARAVSEGLVDASGIGPAPGFWAGRESWQGPH